MNDNSKIIGESFFARLPQNTIPLERDFVRMDKSVIWEFNKYFWQNYMLWEKTYGEHYEASLPSGISESHRAEFIENSAKKFIAFLKRLDAKNQLPEVIYCYEQGPGTGAFAKGFLDYIRRKSVHLYERVWYLISDISNEILETTLKNLEDHKSHVRAYTQNVFEKNGETFAGKILFVRHSNMWDGYPCRLVQIRKTGLADMYVRAICDRKFEPFAQEVQQKGAAYVVAKYPHIWKDFFRNITLQTRSFSCSEIDIRSNAYLHYLQNTNDLYVGKNTLVSEYIFDNLLLINALIDWDKGGYAEIVDIISRHPSQKMYPLKFDGAIGYKIDGKIIETWCGAYGKIVSFKKLRKSNMAMTITKKITKQSISARGLENVCFELYPEDTLVTNVLKFPKNTHIAITCTSKKGLEHTLETAIAIKKQVYNAYPHVIARLVRDEKHIVQINQQLEENNIDEVFVAAGDISEAVGPYSSAMDLLHAWEKIGFPCKNIAITGYPEGHPKISDKKLLEVLLEKQEFATRQNLNMRIISQMCFDPEILIAWANDLRKHGITLPIAVGVPGPCNGLKLLQFAMKCGVGQSLKFISKGTLGKNIAIQLSKQYDPKDLVTKIVGHEKFDQSNITGIHLYSFNNIDAICAWQNANSYLLQKITIDGTLR